MSATKKGDSNKLFSQGSHKEKTILAKHKTDKKKQGNVQTPKKLEAITSIVISFVFCFALFFSINFSFLSFLFICDLAKYAVCDHGISLKTLSTRLDCRRVERTFFNVTTTTTATTYAHQNVKMSSTCLCEKLIHTNPKTTLEGRCKQRRQ